MRRINAPGALHHPITKVDIVHRKVSSQLIKPSLDCEIAISALENWNFTIGSCCARTDSPFYTFNLKSPVLSARLTLAFGSHLCATNLNAALTSAFISDFIFVDSLLNSSLNTSVIGDGNAAASVNSSVSLTFRTTCLSVENFKARDAEGCAQS